MNNFYVYMYLDQDNVPFYIGKGIGDRYFPSLHNRKEQPYLRNKLCKLGYENVKIHFLHKNLTEEEAFTWEKYWIKYIGRKDKKEGTLCNLTNGGDGVSGVIPTEESNLKRSQTLKGRNKGIPLSKETCRKISESNKGVQAGEKNPMFGRCGKDSRHFTSDSKRKISEANKGKVLSEETKQKISESKKGKSNLGWSKGSKHSTESIQKMSDNKKEYWKNKRR